jgi:hypothetical protein
MNPFEPLPREFLPKDLRRFPDVVAHELYVYRAVSRGPAAKFLLEIEAAKRKEMGVRADEVAFRLHDVLLYFAKVAGEGVIGHLAWHTLCRIVKAIRKPTKEFPRNDLKFEIAISKKTYDRIRKEHHPGTRPTLKASPAFEEKAETQYRLMVTLKRTPSKKRTNEKSV